MFQNEFNPPPLKRPPPPPTLSHLLFLPLFSRPPLFTTSYRFPPLGLDWASGHLFAGERGRESAGSQSSFGARSGETEGKDGDTGHTAGIFYPFSTTTAPPESKRKQLRLTTPSWAHTLPVHRGPRSAKRTHPRRETLGRLIYSCRLAASKKENSEGRGRADNEAQICRKRFYTGKGRQAFRQTR